MQQGSRPQNIARYRTGNGQQPNLMTALQPLMNFIYQYPTLIVGLVSFWQFSTRLSGNPATLGERLKNSLLLTVAKNTTLCSRCLSLGLLLALNFVIAAIFTYTIVWFCKRLGQNLVPVKGWWCPAAGKVTVGLARFPSRDKLVAGHYNDKAFKRQTSGRQTLKTCSQRTNSSEVRELSVNGRTAIHVLRTHWAPTVLVSLQPINAKYSCDADARDQWTRRATGSTSCRLFQFSQLRINR